LPPPFSSLFPSSSDFPSSALIQRGTTGTTHAVADGQSAAPPAAIVNSGSDGSQAKSGNSDDSAAQAKSSPPIPSAVAVNQPEASFASMVPVAAAVSAMAHAATEVATASPSGAAAPPATFLPSPRAVLAEAQPAQAQPIDFVRASQLYQNVGGAEMHVSINNDVLGAIELRAVVHQSSLTATLGVERPDVQTLFVNELPALQHALTERNLHVAQISVQGGAVGNSMDLGARGQQEDRSRGSAAPAAMPNASSESPFWGEPALASESLMAVRAVDGQSGINIHV